MRNELPISDALNAAETSQDRRFLALLDKIQLSRIPTTTTIMFQPTKLSMDGIAPVNVQRILAGFYSLSSSWRQVQRNMIVLPRRASCSEDYHNTICIPATSTQWINGVMQAETIGIAEMGDRINELKEYLSQSALGRAEQKRKREGKLLETRKAEGPEKYAPGICAPRNIQDFLQGCAPAIWGPVQYTDLCSWQEVPMESMSSVFAHMFNSQLSAPFDNQRIVGLMDIAGTPEGTPRCRFDFPAMVSHLGPNFAFHDNDYQFSPDKLKKLFPPVQHEPVELSRSATKATLLADQQATVAARAVDLAKHGKELYFSSVWTPSGWFTNTHVDGNGTSQILVHVEEKFGLVGYKSSKPSPQTRAFDNLEGLQVLHVIQPCAFILPPFAIHSVISFSTSSHTGTYFAHSAHWAQARLGLDFAKTLVRNPAFGDIKASVLIEDVLKQEQFWVKAMGEDSDAAEYFAQWKEEMADILAHVMSKDISSV
ncbi:hypothetical protein B0H14DRAFT_3864972 [Mycena olivaceomarginata]|nr:hypothetical protein B0H14DRAFT_3864972 [Mycena olivaceomarginata]